MTSGRVARGTIVFQAIRPVSKPAISLQEELGGELPPLNDYYGVAPGGYRPYLQNLYKKVVYLMRFLTLLSARSSSYNKCSSSCSIQGMVGTFCCVKKIPLLLLLHTAGRGSERVRVVG